MRSPVADSADKVHDEAGDDAVDIQVEPSFVVRDARTANWVVRQIVEARRYGLSAETWAAIEAKRAEQKERFLLDRFGLQIDTWARGELEQRGGRRRSLDLPAGRVGFRNTPASLVVADASFLLPWCRVNLPDAIRLRVDARGTAAVFLERVLASSGPLELDYHVCASVADIRRYVETTGELPPGTEHGRVSERFYVK